MIRRHLAGCWLCFLMLSGTLLVASADDTPRKIDGPSRDQSKPAKQEIAGKPILAQTNLGENTCGACALFNCLQWGNGDLQAVASALPGKSPEDKVRGLLDRYGSKPSEEYGGKEQRYNATIGITWVDLKHLVNDLCQDHKLKPVTGAYLDRHKDEALPAHLQRVHRQLRESLDAGFPPIVAVRSFAAQPEGKEYKWNGLRGHFITVVDLPPQLAENEKGFRFGYLDSETGKLEYGFAYIEEARNFTAAKGNSKKWEWLTDRPFLQVTAPSLRLKTQNIEWHDRTIIILNYVVCRGK